MKKIKSTGQYIAKIIRHNPDLVGISLDENGWASVDELIEGINSGDRYIDFELLQEIVRTDKKQRFSFNEDKSKVRAVQGHSIDVDLELKAIAPPKFLYHGTAVKYLESIKQSGIEKRTRNYVHLSRNEEIAKDVGARHGVPVILKIDAEKMNREGYEFFMAENGVYLTDYVPYKYVVEVLENLQD